jgi:ribosome maturation factor RimP
MNIVNDCGYRVAFLRHGFGGGKTIEVAVENQDYSPMTIKEIEKLHKFLVTKLYVEGLIDDSTSIDLGSPGLDRPLFSSEDFQRFTGSVIKVQLKQDVGGRKKLQGILQQVDKDAIVLELAQEKDKVILAIHIDNISQASLIPQINFSKVK